MSQFWSFFPSVDKLQEQAASAATKAQSLAKELAEKTQDAATVAANNAKQLTMKLAEDAKSLTEEGGWQAAASKAKEKWQQAMHFKDPFVPTGKDFEVSQEELELYGITAEFKDFIRSLDYSTFRDFNEEQLNANVGFVLDQKGNLRLNPWQVKHCKLALQTSHELEHLRYLLCPKRMSEEKFWLVYFSLSHTHLPAGCKTGVLPETSQVDYTPIKTEESVETEEVTGKESPEKEKEEEEEDDLDKYLNDVLEEGSNREHSSTESFDNLDDFMEELNADRAQQELESQEDSKDEEPKTKSEGPSNSESKTE